MPAKRLTIHDVRLSITASPEGITPANSYRIPVIKTDEEELKRFVSDVEDMVGKYDLWGWCQVEVKAKLGSLSGSAYLGSCSYEDEADFKRGGYYEQMVEEAIEELQAQVDELYELIHVEEGS